LRNLALGSIIVSTGEEKESVGGGGTVCSISWAGCQGSNRCGSARRVAQNRFVTIAAAIQTRVRLVCQPKASSVGRGRCVQPARGWDSGAQPPGGADCTPRGVDFAQGPWLDAIVGGIADSAEYVPLRSRLRLMIGIIGTGVDSPAQQCQQHVL